MAIGAAVLLVHDVAQLFEAVPDRLAVAADRFMLGEIADVGNETILTGGQILLGSFPQRFAYSHFPLSPNALVAIHPVRALVHQRIVSTLHKLRVTLTLARLDVRSEYRRHIASVPIAGSGARQSGIRL